jgi:hypothetical protein
MTLWRSLFASGPTLWRSLFLQAVCNFACVACVASCKEENFGVISNLAMNRITLYVGRFSLFDGRGACCALACCLTAARYSPGSHARFCTSVERAAEMFRARASGMSRAQYL